MELLEVLVLKLAYFGSFKPPGHHRFHQEVCAHPDQFLKETQKTNLTAEHFYQVANDCTAEVFAAPPLALMSTLGLGI